MYSGVLVLALPISVMGWIHLHAREREEKKKHQEEESNSEHNYESDDDDNDFNNSEWELEKWAIRNDGVLVRKTPMQWPSGSGDGCWGAILRVATWRHSAGSNAGSSAGRSFSSTSQMSARSDGRQCSNPTGRASRGGQVVDTVVPTVKTRTTVAKALTASSCCYYSNNYLCS
jgi:hypothetical protein